MEPPFAGGRLLTAGGAIAKPAAAGLTPRKARRGKPIGLAAMAPSAWRLFVRAWRNGRRAGLRSQSFGVWVQVPPPAPNGKAWSQFTLQAFFISPKSARVLRIVISTNCAKGAESTCFRRLFYSNHLQYLQIYSRLYKANLS